MTNAIDEGFVRPEPDDRSAEPRAGRWLLFENRLFSEWRLRFYGSGAVVAYALSLAWRVLHGQSFMRPDGKVLWTDFCWMWLSGHFVTSGQADHIYDPAVFRGAELALVGSGNYDSLLPFDYPPTFLFLTTPIGLLPYQAAFAAWDLVTLIFYLAAVYAIISRPAALVVAATPFFVPVNLDFGHNGFVTAGLIGFSLVLIERRPWLCGPFLGLLTYKPHFGVLFPLALLVSRNWRALFSAIVGSLLLTVGAAIAFGYEAWPSFVSALFHRHSIMSPDGKFQLWVHSVYGLFYWAGAGGAISWAAQLVVATVVTVAVCAVWAKPYSHSLKAAALCLGSLTVIPYLLFYDLCILSIAAAFLVKDGLSRGFLRGERTVLLLCWAALFLVRMPIGPIVSIVLFALVMRRVVVYGDASGPTERPAIGGAAEELARAVTE
jgi:hypothetical protein